MCNAGAVETETLSGLPKVPADDIDKHVGIDRVGLLKEIVVIERDEASAHVPAMLFGKLRVAPNIVGRYIVGTKKPHVGFRILVAHRLIGKVSERLVILNRPGDLLIDIGCDHLGTPVAVIGTQEATVGNVMEQASQD